MQETTEQAQPETARKIFRFACMIACLLLATIGVVGGLTYERAFSSAGNDDVMRLMSVRDWLSGQGWFDMHQYRILPDDALSLHWSRYIDAGIGATISFLALVVPMQSAEHFAAVLWPLLLAFCLIAIVGRSTRHLFGDAAGAIAILMVVCYPPLALGYFGTAQFDHHNVQIVLITIAALSLAQSDDPARHGIYGGLAAAASLAVGLETMFVVVAISLLHVTDVIIRRDGARQRLCAFAGTIAAASLLLFIGQTPRAEWLLAQCDELAPPILALTIVGAGAALAGLLVTYRSRSLIVFIATVACVAGAGLALAYPLLSPCLQSPYASLPEATQEIIASRIIEALPLRVFFEQHQTVALSYFGPALAVLGIATFIWLRGIGMGKDWASVGHLLLLGWIGFIAAFWQMRQVVILATVVPTLTGYIVGPILMERLKTRSGKSQMALYAACAVTLFQPVFLIGAEGVLASSQVSASTDSANARAGQPTTGQDELCYDLAGLQKLNVLSPQTILTGTNLGPRLIMATHHAGLAAPYHRSNAALTNGFALALAEPSEFANRLADLGADVVVTCRGSIYGDPDSVGSRLAAGDTVAGLERIALDDANLLVFKVVAREP